MSTLVTEKEAQEMNCPVVMAGSYPGVSCKAARCMAWRWGVNRSPASLSFHTEQPGWKPRGYCGLAGRADE